MLHLLLAASILGGAPTTRRMFTSAIQNHDDFVAYSREVGGERFTKLVLDLRGGSIYFFDVDVYPVHKDFVFAEIYKEKITRARLKAFQANYRDDKPEFVLGYLVHHLAADKWTFALWEGDRARPHHIEKTYAKLLLTFYLAKELSYRPDSNQQERMAKNLKKVPVIDNDTLYKSAPYRGFNPGTAVGRLRFFTPGVPFDELIFEPEQMVVLPEPLPDITPVAGIISETFSSPLSHVNLRARAWGIPNIGLKGAIKKYRALAGQWVLLEATQSRYSLRAASPKEVAAAKEKKKKRPVLVPSVDLTVHDLRDLRDLRAKEGGAFGAKAANLGEVAHANIKGVVVPPGFAVPLSWYAAHLRRAGLDKRIEKLLANPRLRTDSSWRKEALRGIRKTIVQSPIDPTYHKKLVAWAAKWKGGSFVRSSTNAEDLSGFSGAGLYDTVPNVVGDKPLIDAVRTVWASVWNFRAFAERELFGIDHKAVYGGVLIQQGVDATAAGVLVTQHPTDPTDRKSYTINAKRGLGIGVVEGRQVPEILIYDWRNHGLRVISRSSEKTMLVFDAKGGTKEIATQPGEPVLTDKRARALGRATRAMTKLFKDPVLDIEWLLVNDQVMIVQVRPFVTGP